MGVVPFRMLDWAVDGEMKLTINTEQERFPSVEGWQPPAKQITLAKFNDLISQIMVASGDTDTINTTRKAM